jgi:hypothetical protein
MLCTSLSVQCYQLSIAVLHLQLSSIIIASALLQLTRAASESLQRSELTDLTSLLLLLLLATVSHYWLQCKISKHCSAAVKLLPLL